MEGGIDVVAKGDDEKDGSCLCEDANNSKERGRGEGTRCPRVSQKLLTNWRGYGQRERGKKEKKMLRGAREPNKGRSEDFLDSRKMEGIVRLETTPLHVREKSE